MDRIVEEFIEKMTDKIAEKVADILEKRQKTENQTWPRPIDNVVVMYGCQFSPYQEITTEIKLDTKTSSDIIDLTTIVEDKEK